jgi:nucleoid-associated protein YejK
MELEEFTGITTKIAQNLNNQALVTELLSSLNEGYTNVKTTYDSIQQQNNDFQKEIKTLQQTNMNLFLKVSAPKLEKEIGKPEPLKYEDIVVQLGGTATNGG